MEEKDTTEAVDVEQILKLLGTSGLSIKNLDETTKKKVRIVMRSLHHEKGLSLGDIAKLIGNKTSGYTSWLFKQLQIQPRPFEESRLKAIKEKRRKYERKPFDGTDEDKAYLLALRHGDLSVSKPWKGVVKISTSTTHPAMYELFEKLFNPYGHVYRHPRFKEDTKSYEWNVSTIVDSSFEFLIQEFDESLPWVRSSEQTTIAYLSGLLDAEGSIILTRDQFGKVALFLDFYNSNKAMLEWVEYEIRALGYFTSLRINKHRGVRTKKWGIIHRSDYWQLSSYGMDRIQELIAKMNLRHSEKVRRQRLAQSVHKGQEYASIVSELNDLRSSIKREVQTSILTAEEMYKLKHNA